MICRSSTSQVIRRNTEVESTNNPLCESKETKGPTVESESTIRLTRVQLAKMISSRSELAKVPTTLSITLKEEVDPTLTQDNCHHGSPSDRLVPIGHTSRLKNPTNNIDGTEIRTSLKADKVLSMLVGRLNKI